METGVSKSTEARRRRRVLLGATAAKLTVARRLGRALPNRVHVLQDEPRPIYDDQGRMVSRPCLDCGALHSRRRGRGFQSYCGLCANERCAESRPSYGQLLESQRQKSNARAYANVYQRRGKLTRQACEVCGSPESQKHHDDYQKPLQVRWLCRRCHLSEHGLFRVEQQDIVSRRPTLWGDRRPWQYKPAFSGECSRCPNKRDGAGRYCLACQRAYGVLWRAQRAKEAA